MADPNDPNITEQKKPPVKPEELRMPFSLDEEETPENADDPNSFKIQKEQYDGTQSGNIIDLAGVLSTERQKVNKHREKQKKQKDDLTRMLILNEYINNLLKQINELEDKIKNNEEQIEELENENKFLEREIKRNEPEIKRIEKELQEKSFKELTLKDQRLFKENENNKKQLIENKNKIKELKNENRKHEDAINEHKENITNAENNNVTAEAFMISNMGSRSNNAREAQKNIEEINKTVVTIQHPPNTKNALYYQVIKEDEIQYILFNGQNIELTESQSAEVESQLKQEPPKSFANEEAVEIITSRYSDISKEYEEIKIKIGKSIEKNTSTLEEIKKSRTSFIDDIKGSYNLNTEIGENGEIKNFLIPNYLKLFVNEAKLKEIKEINDILNEYNEIIAEQEQLIHLDNIILNNFENDDFKEAFINWQMGYISTADMKENTSPELLKALNAVVDINIIKYATENNLIPEEIKELIKAVEKIDAEIASHERSIKFSETSIALIKKDNSEQLTQKAQKALEEYEQSIKEDKVKIESLREQRKEECGSDGSNSKLEIIKEVQEEQKEISKWDKLTLDCNPKQEEIVNDLRAKIENNTISKDAIKDILEKHPEHEAFIVRVIKEREIQISDPVQKTSIGIDTIINDKSEPSRKGMSFTRKPAVISPEFNNVCMPPKSSEPTPESSEPISEPESTSELPLSLPSSGM
ncbi:MAG: hypothetical protein KAJ86_05105 [Alphaproteobacteria bacterium]|nr:hypothetical protein [Alphaproteobacteria bacterium]